MRLVCNFCCKSVSNEVPDDTIVRAALICPECLEAGKVVIKHSPIVDEMPYQVNA